jgi:UDP-N-acetylmuramate dehydrogenase
MRTGDVAARLPGVRVERGASLAPLTTFRVGGPADWLVTATRTADIVAAHAVARDLDLPFTVLGGGSNVLVADAGIRGVVVRVHGGEVRQVDEGGVCADAGVTINGLVRWTIGRGLAALEAWAGTPGTVGGAIRGNAHFRGRNIGELVSSVTLLAPDGGPRPVPAAAMAFAYDSSRIQQSGEVVLDATFAVRSGDPAVLRAVARESLAFRKATQPLHLPSAGCVFQNPVRGVDPVPPDIPASAGALVDRAGLKGVSEGGASVSPVHGNFIVTSPAATAADVRRLIERCRAAVRERFGVELRDEIVYLGF